MMKVNQFVVILCLTEFMLESFDVKAAVVRDSATTYVDVETAAFECAIGAERMSVGHLGMVLSPAGTQSFRASYPPLSRQYNTSRFRKPL